MVLAASLVILVWDFWKLVYAETLVMGWLDYYRPPLWELDTWLPVFSSLVTPDTIARFFIFTLAGPLLVWAQMIVLNASTAHLYVSSELKYLQAARRAMLCAASGGLVYLVFTVLLVAVCLVQSRERIWIGVLDRDVPLLLQTAPVIAGLFWCASASTVPKSDGDAVISVAVLIGSFSAQLIAWGIVACLVVIW
jgi:hypothetical protein